MHMDLGKRLQMLVDSGQISLRVADVCSELVAIAQKELGRSLTAENAGGFVTHAALAMERLVRGQPVAGISDNVLAEVKARPEWRVARHLAAYAAQRLEVAIPEAEIAFLAAHLCILDEVSG